MREVIHNSLTLSESYPQIRVMFYDDERFGRITDVSYCWCAKGVRPAVLSLHVREYTYITPYTPEMNPTEQLWDEIKEKHFKNHFFDSLKKVTDHLCRCFKDIPLALQSLCRRDWIVDMF